jgi:predicted amidohydrolase
MPADPNLADLFAQLWHRLAANITSFQKVLEEQERQRGAIREAADYLDGVLETEGPQALPVLSGWLAGRGVVVPDSEIDRVVLAAQAIDRWHAPLSSGFDTKRRDVALARANRTLLKFGRLNMDPDLGYVLLKRPRWGRWSDPDLELPDAGTSPWDAFKSLIVTPTEIFATDPDDQARPRAVRFSYSMVDPTTLRAVAPDWEPVIGFAPIAERPEDIDIELVQGDTKHWYDTRARDLGARASAAVEALCSAGAHIIVFPEMVVHPEAIAAIQSATATYGPASQLRMVLAGTSRQLGAGARPFNEALLFNHRGTNIGRQRKLHRWNLSRDLRARYGLQPPDLDDAADLFEFITPGEEVVVIEQAQFGRIAVMICEDLGRSEPGQWLRDHMLLDWLLTPIFDSSMHPSRWMAQRGRDAALGGRCRVIVANSFSLTHMQNAENRKAGRATLDVCGTALCVDIEGGKAKYRLEQLPINGPSDLTCTVRWDPPTWTEVDSPSRGLGHKSQYNQWVILKQPYRESVARKRSIDIN